MAYWPDRPSGGEHHAYLETRDAIYQLISCLEGLIPQITGRRERRDTFELLGRLETMIVEVMITEELEGTFWEGPASDEND